MWKNEALLQHYVMILYEWIIDHLINIVRQEDDLKLYNDVILFMASFILRL